ncbi:hypothetical protein E2C01_080985 [Portunus trituberculatus]|uniref:Uncharacterized protein n=1 Tax=Portunus trituberculatus TaxID=210409 RepID=A0A5B7IVF0_PORTR|nr:hypothetical protein [Portunus trituberculatus]
MYSWDMTVQSSVLCGAMRARQEGVQGGGCGRGQGRQQGIHDTGVFLSRQTSHNSNEQQPSTEDTTLLDTELGTSNSSMVTSGHATL